MRKFIFITTLIVLFTACEKKEVVDLESLPNATLFQQIKSPTDADTTAIRFVYALKGNSDATGLCYCFPVMDSTSTPPKSTISNGSYIRFTKHPLKYYFTTFPQLFSKKNKTVVYFEADSIADSMYRVKITFPDTTAIVIKNGVKVTEARKDTLVFNALAHKIKADFTK